MRIREFRHALSSCAAAALLSGCGGSQPLIGAPGVVPQSQTFAVATNADRNGSWMLPEAKSEDLLYVSNSGYASKSADVLVYSYPKGRLVGKLKKFSIPGGMCVDPKGDIYITDLGFNKIFEYKHGSKRRVWTLTGYGGPVGCSIDPTTGNLAASGIHSALAVYANARGTPAIYTNSSLWEDFWCSYDDKGDLFVDGQNLPSDGSKFVFFELANGSSSLTPITLNQSMGFPGGVQWDGKYMAVGSYYPPPTGEPIIYQFNISGSSGTEIGSTPLGSGAFDVMQFWIDGKTVVAPNEESGGGGDALFFHYPAGGSAYKIITKGIRGGLGAAISLAPQ